MCALIARRRAVETRERTAALVTIAAEVIDALSRREEPPRPARLRRPDRQDAAAARRTATPHWVHYKLDLGIDHVLIDEAQDTSAQQWDIVAALIAEFTAGAGARDGHALDLRGRRREAVDLLVPGRGAAAVRGDAAALRAPRTSGRAALRGREVPVLVPLGADRARGGRHGVQPRAGVRGRRPTDAGADRARGGARAARRAWSSCGR